MSLRAPQLWAVVCAVAMCASCVGDLPSDEQIDNRIDALKHADSGVLDSNAGGEDTSAADAQTDTGGMDAVTSNDVGADVPKADECITDTDCVGKKKGATSCNVPHCDGGICNLKKLEIGTKCTPLIGAPGECELAQCDSTGTCKIGPRTDGEACGPYKCGKQCTAGECKPVGAEAYDDDNPCTNDYCKDGQEVVHDPITDVGGKCEDGDVCTETGFCFEGTCTTEKIVCDDGIDCTVGVCKSGEGCKFAGNDKECDDGDACTIDKCGVGIGCQVDLFAAATVTCDDGNSCTKDDTCDGKGKCDGTAICTCKVNADCAQENLCLGKSVCQNEKCVLDEKTAVTCDDSNDTECLKATCDPKTGTCAPVKVADSTKCDDGSACTTTSTCVDGVCDGNVDVKCDDDNPCTDDKCDPTQGCAKTPIDGASCDDKSACTSGDICSKGGCVGTPKDCNDGIACTVDKCDAKTGKCSSEADPSACDDGNPCTKDECSTTDKACKSTADDAGKCDDGNSCTTDACKGGQCVGTNTCDCKSAADCDDGNPCTKDECFSGKCSLTAVEDSAKQACDTADKCQQPGSGVCKSGVCASGDKPKDCSSAGDACNIGTCEPKSGKCVATPKTDGAQCDADKNGCTVKDYCKAGLCLAGPAPNCSEKDTTCVKGQCKSEGSDKYTCENKNLAKGTKCNDGQYCVVDETCDGAGKCTSTKKRACASVADACNTGLCDEKADLCVKQAKKDGTQCSDGNPCTQNDGCKTGKCIAGTAKACPDPGKCQAGKCDAKTGLCGAINDAKGAGCDDGNKCTKVDSCDGAGKCTGSSAVMCKPSSNPCLVSSCNALTGACQTLPAAKGAKCDDNEVCTQTDACDGNGQCVGSNWNTGSKGCECKDDKDCNDGNHCTSDKCDKKECQYAAEDGEKCDDGNSCSKSSKCDANSACVGLDFETCPTGSACILGTCDGSGKDHKCIKTPKPKGTNCNDGNPCTSASACNGSGACVGTKNKSCDDKNPCTNDSCDKTKGCQHTERLCSDNNACTNDTCKVITTTYGVCVHANKSCNDEDPCTYDFCNKNTGACYHTNVPDGLSCNDGNKCTLSRCKSAKCTFVRNKCIDGNPCTADSCDKATGKCKYTPLSGTACNDGDPCTTTDKCQKVTISGVTTGKCVGSGQKVCDDGKPCTTDYCEKGKGCRIKLTADGTACEDGLKCTIQDKCVTGVCKGTIRTCDDKRNCTTDSCDTSTGLCIHAQLGFSCKGPGCKTDGSKPCPASSDACLKSVCKTAASSSEGLGGLQCYYEEKCQSGISDGN